MLRGNFLVNHEFKTRKWSCGIPLPIKFSLHHKRNDSEKKTTFIQAISHKLEKRLADEGGGGGVVRHGVGIFTLSLKKFKLPTPGTK